MDSHVGCFHSLVWLAARQAAPWNPKSTVAQGPRLPRPIDPTHTEAPQRLRAQKVRRFRRKPHTSLGHGRSVTCVTSAQSREETTHHAHGGWKEPRDPRRGLGHTVNHPDSGGSQP